MTEEKREVCAACHWPLRKGGIGGLDNSCWVGRSLEGTALCRERTVARLAKRITEQETELSALRQQLEAERHGVWEAGYSACLYDAVGALDPHRDPSGNPAVTKNPYPPPAEAPALPVGKETE